MNEADTCRELVRPKLDASGWDRGRHSYVEQTTFTDGRIVVAGGTARRQKQKRTDFLLRYTRDVTLAVVEAKSLSKPVGTGLQQAKDYAEILGLKFAYATNGREILELGRLHPPPPNHADSPSAMVAEAVGPSACRWSWRELADPRWTR